MRTCVAHGCDNPVPRNRRGRPAIYCSPACRRPSRRAGLVVEVDHPETSPDGPPAARVWQVRLRRGRRVVVVAGSLGWPTANALATQLDELLNPPRRQRGVAID